MTLFSKPDPPSLIPQPTSMEVNLKALEDNFLALKRLVAPARVMAVVKANAYGHGLIPCAQHLEQSGADFFGVAHVSEGIELRQAGIQAPILVLGGIFQAQLKHFVEYELDVTASSVSKLEAIETMAQELQKKARVHLKIDTGMERLGVHFYNAEALFTKALRCAHCEIVGVFSHFASSEEEDHSFARLQLERFQEVLRFFERHSVPVPLRHMANSGAILQFSESHFDMVRPGICLYGVYPAAHLSGKIQLQPVMSLHSTVVYFKVVPSGAGVSYGLNWHTPQETRIVTVPIGYGDGYSRRHSNAGQVLIRGKRYSIVGSICMDQLMVDIGPQGTAYNGDEVVLIGNQGEECITVTELADRIGTIPYEILTAINSRVPRRYSEGP